jgi:hypothetical protein
MFKSYKNVDNLNMTLNSKASLNHIMTLQDEKANKKDYYSMML